MGKVRHYTLEIIACLLTFALFYVLKDGGITKYIVLLGISAVFFLYGLKNFEKEFLIFCVPSMVYIVVGVPIAVLTGSLSFQAIKEIAFAVAPLAAAISFFVVSKKLGIDFIKWQYWSMVALTLAWLRYYWVEDVTETQYAFIFGVFLLYFCIVKKNIKYIIFTTLMLYLMNKRIAMLAAVMMLVLYDIILYVVKRKPEWQKKIPQYLSFAATLGFIGYVLFLCVVNLEGQFVQDLTSGRSLAWDAVKNEYGLSTIWLGKGLGDVVNLLGRLQYPNYTTNLHNDLLKVYIEIGTLGYAIWILCHFMTCYWISKKKNLDFKKSLFLYLVMIYTLINYMTDNIMVYVNYWFPAFLMILAVVFSNGTEKHEEVTDNRKEQKILLGVIMACSVCVLADVALVYLDYRNPSKFTIPDDAAEGYSPGGVTRVSVWVREGRPYYRIRHAGENLIEPSVLGVETSQVSFRENVEIKEIIYPQIVEVTTIGEGVFNPIKESYQPIFITMQKDSYELGIELRVYDHGVVFRYVLPRNTNEYKELTQMRFLEGSMLAIYDEASEIGIKELSTKKMEKIIYRFPFTAKYEDGIVLEISEICEEGQNISCATKADWKKRTLEIQKFSATKNENEDNIQTPWRVFEILNSK